MRLASTLTLAAVLGACSTPEPAPEAQSAQQPAEQTTQTEPEPPSVELVCKHMIGLLSTAGRSDEALARARAHLKAADTAVDKAEEVGDAFAGAAGLAFNGGFSTAVLISQRVIGAKGFGQE